jgi:hypothetical protein
VPSVSVEAADIGGTGQAGSGFPVVVLAAAVLAAERVSGVLVGSAALRLRGEPVSVGDVDVVIEPGEANLQRLHEALVLIDLAQPWKLPVPLVERRGNFGSRGNDPPASPRYTEARLSPAGQVALARRDRAGPDRDDQRQHAPGGRSAAVPACCAHGRDPAGSAPARLPAARITGIAGPPDFLTGCTVTGDLAALAAGQHAELGLHARVMVTDGAYVSDRVAKATIPRVQAAGLGSWLAGR